MADTTQPITINQRLESVLQGQVAPKFVSISPQARRAAEREHQPRIYLPPDARFDRRTVFATQGQLLTHEI